MKNTTCDAAEVWKQFEDLLAPRLHLSVTDRVAYSHLLRHSRLEGKLQFQFSILWLARGIGLSDRTARDAVRRLINQGALFLVERNTRGHVVEVRLPEEICAVREHPMGDRESAQQPGAASPNIEDLDFMQSRALRQAIHAREGGLCFYCLRRLTASMQGLDHVVPRAQSGCGSYRNLVSCCLECNSRKGETSAGDFLRWLFREGRLTPAELTGRLRALEDLASGKLLPALVEAGFSLPCKGPASFPLESHGGHSCSAPLECGGLTPLFRHTRFPAMAQASSFREAGSHQAAADSAPVSATAPPETTSVSTTSLAEMERMTILRVFEQARGDKALAGKMLGISRATLYRKLKRYNIPIQAAPGDVATEPQPPS